MKNFSLVLSVMALLLISGAVAAQEETTETPEDVAEAIALDEDIQPEDLGTSEPTILPDNPFYFFKTWGRTIQTTFAFNAIKKAELKEKFANEKLMELKQMIEKKKDAQFIKKAAKNYQEEADRIKAAAEKIKQKTDENPQVGKFLDKLTQHQILHQRVLQKLETQVPPEVFEKIEEAREKHLETFGEVMTRLENKERIPERLEKNLQEIKGSEFKEFKNLEMLKSLEEKVPDAAKEAIRKAQENTLKQLRGNLEKITPEAQEKFKGYIEKVSGVKEKKMEILDNLREELKAVPQIKETILQSREKIMEKVREVTAKKNCPEVEKPTSDFCKEGRIAVKRDEKGCVVSFDCISPVQSSTSQIKP